MRGDMLINGRRYAGVYLLLYNEQTGIQGDVGSIGAVAEIHIRRGTDDYYPVAVLIAAQARVVNGCLTLRGFFRSGQDQEDGSLCLLANQTHRSAVIEFTPYGPDDQDEREPHMHQLKQEDDTE